MTAQTGFYTLTIKTRRAGQLLRLRLHRLQCTEGLRRGHKVNQGEVLDLILTLAEKHYGLEPLRNTGNEA